jgi:Fic/DOC family
MKEVIDHTISDSGPFRLRPSLIQELNRLSIQRIEADAGRWRDVEIGIGQSRHEPPPWLEVPRYIDEMCEYVNENWERKPAVHLAAYVMWRLNWIHPFVDGNGRTTRAVSYYVLCSKLHFRIPGVKTIPELIAANKQPYYDALEQADTAYKQGRIDVSEMEGLLKDCVAKQMYDALGQERSAERLKAPTQSYSVSKRAEENGRPRFSSALGAIAGLAALAFFMCLVLIPIFGHPIPSDAKLPLVLVMAFAGALSFSQLGGSAIARGTIPLPNAPQHSVRYALTGAAAVFIVLLVVGKFLFM